MSLEEHFGTMNSRTIEHVKEGLLRQKRTINDYLNSLRPLMTEDELEGADVIQSAMNNMYNSVLDSVRDHLDARSVERKSEDMEREVYQ